MSKIGNFFKKWLKPIVKMGKPYLRAWAEETLIPQLQEKINAGAKNIDKHIDGLIKEGILELINKKL